MDREQEPSPISREIEKIIRLFDDSKTTWDRQLLKWVLILAPLVFAVLIGLENHKLKQTFRKIEEATAQYMSATVQGKPVRDFIKAGSLSLFHLEGQFVLCGQVEAQ